MTQNLTLAKMEDGSPELFLTLQGEGRSTGLPRVFLRLARCNLHCYWCDTDYTWNFEGTNFEHRRDETAASKHKVAEVTCTYDVDELVERLLAFECSGLVITGGEPLLQQPGLVALLATLKARRETFVEIETNGTIVPQPALVDLVDQFNVSPKLAHSRNSDDVRINGDALATFAGLDEAWFKFVVANEGDIEEVLALIEAHALPRDRTLLMPEGISSEALRQKEPWIVQAALAHGLGFTDRMHIHLFGNTRGT